MAKITIKSKGFDSAHYLAGEGLHGHHYHLELDITGDIEKGMVHDFIDAERRLNEAGGELDHKLILGKSDATTIKGEFITAREGYVFPKKDVVIIPYASSTSESIGLHLLEKLKPNFPRNKKLTIRIGERPETMATIE
ncbi:hypothetical protein COX84_04930 [Candidatus Micrarchaeota archaeon CG_4_10_14_0_2_um_filter_49_7]|nr:MAG: hypothetical protein COS70_05680 [Candidatus Micrarchaeota archaeon CG06_land_8_20_14_3_00_50_6]PIZ94796.1 MAG: hypothetical protein COX84_04930 [Candidatus Micrarchaeota archaeon CG_4_10_14_0_2_um_filter_49_7]